MTFISAKEGPPNYGSTVFTVQYFDEQENMTIRSGGTKAWRNNNPGNMVYHTKGFAVRHGAIEKAGGMAVFPSETIGRQALIDLLKSINFAHLSITQLPEKYDKGNAQEYRRMLFSICKVDPHKIIKNLTEQEFDNLRISIERIEGWKVGQEDFIKKWYISGVHKKRGTITEYLIDKDGKNTWLAKEEALKLAEEGRLLATVVHLKNGTAYLRPKYGNPSFTRLT